MSTPQPAASRLAHLVRATVSDLSSLKRLRLLVVAALLAAPFAAVTQSSNEGHERAVLEESLRRGADRLVSLQSADGLWARVEGDKGDLRQAGHVGGALLLAWQVTHDPRHFMAARRAARAIGQQVREGRGTSSGNLRLLADMGHAAGEPSLVEAARHAWISRFQSTLPADGREAARQLLATPPMGGVGEGDWRNYLLCRAAEEADLARSLGHEAWADAFLLEAAGAWAPKHDHGYWTSAAGSLLSALARSSDPAARRLEMAHRGLLESNELIDGISWNDTPYDAYVYASETASALAGRSLHERGARVGSPTFLGLEFLASRQAPHGGWGELLSLVDEVARQGDDELAPAASAALETPQLNAQVVSALALGLGARG